MSFLKEAFSELQNKFNAIFIQVPGFLYFFVVFILTVII